MLVLLLRDGMEGESKPQNADTAMGFLFIYLKTFYLEIMLQRQWGCNNKNIKIVQKQS